MSQSHSMQNCPFWVFGETSCTCTAVMHALDPNAQSKASGTQMQKVGANKGQAVESDHGHCRRVVGTSQKSKFNIVLERKEQLQMILL